MYDKNLFHVDRKVNYVILENINGHFGDLSIQQGIKLEFLIIDITFYPYGSVSIGMEDYLRESIAMFPEDV